MKRRITTVLNFFALNLLFFALYLNFVHKDKDVLESIHSTSHSASNATLVENRTSATPKDNAKEATKQLTKSTVN